MILIAAPAAAGQVELISRIDSSQTSDSGAGPFLSDFDSDSPPSLSADGRYLAFVSPNPNLVPGQRDINGDGQLVALDVFVRDLVAGTTTLVSHVAGSETTAGNDGSGQRGMVLSADGRWVAFTSQATDLVPGQPVSSYGNVYVFLYDQMAKTMILVATTGDSNNQFWDLSISADGRYLTFSSNASDLIPGLPYSLDAHVFLFDRGTRQLKLVDHKRGHPELPGDGGGSSQGISADGRYVLFVSAAGGLVAGQKPDDGLFLYDRTTAGNVAVGPAEGRTLLSADGRYVAAFFGTPYTWDRQTGVRTPLSGPTAGQVIELSAISADGRYVLYQRADGDNNFTPVLYDRVARTYTQTARPPTTLNRISQLSLSADGRYAVFADPEADVLPGESNPNRLWNVFLFDRQTQTTSLVSHSTSPLTAGNAASFSPAINANGSRVVFSSQATDLVPGARDLNDGLDLFSYEVATGATGLVTRRAPSLPSLAAEGTSTARAVSADGRWVAFESDAAHLVAGQADTNGRKDVFLYDRTIRQTVLVSHSAASAVTAGNGVSLQPSLSADGRYVSFLSSADDLAAGVTPQAGYYNVYVFDRTTGATRFVARTIGSGSSDETLTGEQHISADGNWVAFTSTADDLVSGEHQAFYAFNVFLWSRETGGLALVSRSSLHADLSTGHGASTSPWLSADGRYVAFRSAADDLVPGQTAEPPSSFDAPTNIFLYDRVTGGSVLVSHGPTAAAAGASVDSPPSISADGRFVVFASAEGNLAPGVNGPDQSAYLYDRTLGTNRWIAAGARGDVPRISADGGTVALISDRPLLPGIEPDTLELYLYSVAAKTLTLATPSRRPGVTGSAGDLSSAYDLSADGRYVAFSTDAHDLVAGEVPPPPPVTDSLARDLYLFDRATGAMVLVSRSKGSSVAATGLARFPLLSADGHRVAFTSDSALADGDFNRRSDAYLFDLDAGPGGGGPVTVPPCSLFDVSLRSNVLKVLAVAGACGVPAGAHRVAVKVTARQGSGQGNLRLYPGDVTTTPSGTLRFQKGQTAASSFDLPLATNGAGTLAVLPFVRGNGTVRVTVEVDGYTP